MDEVRIRVAKLKARGRVVDYMSKDCGLPLSTDDCRWLNTVGPQILRIMEEGQSCTYCKQSTVLSVEKGFKTVKIIAHVSPRILPLKKFCYETL